MERVSSNQHTVNHTPQGPGETLVQGRITDAASCCMKGPTGIYVHISAIKSQKPQAGDRKAS